MMRWMGQVAWTGESSNRYKMSVSKLEGNRSCVWEKQGVKR